MNLKSLFENMPLKRPLPALTQSILGLSADSRTTQKGDLFFDLESGAQKDDSHAREALAKGALAVVTSKDNGEDGPWICVDQIRDVLAKASCAFFKEPSQAFYLNGVTGTNGKTTTTYILKSLWQEERAGLLGTVCNHLPNHVEKATLTTPDALTLQKYFFEFKKAKTRFVTMEVSSHALDQSRTLGSQFDSAVFTNLTQDHLDYHGDMTHYFERKKLLFTQELKLSRKADKCAVINLDSPYAKDLIHTLGEIKIKTNSFSLLNPSADLFCNNYTTSLDGSTFDFSYEGQRYTGETSLIGSYNIENIMAAILVAHHSKIDLTCALKNLETLSVPGRLERIKKEAVFVDFAHTPDALKQVLKTLKAYINGSGKLIVVFGCGGDRDKIKRPIMGKIASEMADIVVMTSDNPRTENPTSIIEAIQSGITNNKTEIYSEPDRARAIQMALGLKKTHDVVLIAGKGHETEQIMGENCLHFDDREVARQYL